MSFSKFMCSFLLAFILCQHMLCNCLERTKNPIILVPGDGGSQAYCDPKKGESNFLLWVNLRYFLSPGTFAQYFSKLRQLIEETYENAGKNRVVLLGHSLGSLYSLTFLHTATEDWKRKYIKTFLSVSGPLGGSVKAMKIQASGDNFGIYIRSPLSFRPVQRSLPSLAFLLPDERLWSPDEALIITPTVNYSAHDYERFFQDIGYPLGYKLMLETKSSVDGFIGPSGIDEVYCIHGSSIPTTYRMIYSPATFYRSGFPDQYPTIVPGNGDGTVHMRSLELCRFWPGAKHVVLDGAEHLRIVGDPRLIEIIGQVSGAEIPSV